MDHHQEGSRDAASGIGTSGGCGDDGGVLKGSGGLSSS